VNETLDLKFKLEERMYKVVLDVCLRLLVGKNSKDFNVLLGLSIIKKLLKNEERRKDITME